MNHEKQDIDLPDASAVPVDKAIGSIQVGLLVLLAVYFLSQGVAYIQADPRNTFQGTGCISANPTDQSPIINYMQQAKIRYAWATGWLGDPITFKTNGALLVTELSWPYTQPIAILCYMRIVLESFSWYNMMMLHPALLSRWMPRMLPITLSVSMQSKVLIFYLSLH